MSRIPYVLPEIFILNISNMTTGPVSYHISTLTSWETIAYNLLWWLWSYRQLHRPWTWITKLKSLVNNQLQNNLQNIANSANSQSVDNTGARPQIPIIPLISMLISILLIILKIVKTLCLPPPKMDRYPLRCYLAILLKMI